jgi:hypothetical protein
LERLDLGLTNLKSFRIKKREVIEVEPRHVTVFLHKEAGFFVLIGIKHSRGHVCFSVLNDKLNICHKY